MGIEREDIVQVLNTMEVPLMERAEKAGIRPNSFYNKLRQFKAAYPDNWQEQVDEWLKTAADGRARESRVAALREQVRIRRLELVSIDHENEEDALLQELAELDERIAEKKAEGKGKKEPGKGKVPGKEKRKKGKATQPEAPKTGEAPLGDKSEEGEE